MSPIMRPVPLVVAFVFLAPLKASAQRLQMPVVLAPYSTPRFIPGVLPPSELLRALKDYGHLIHPLQA